MRIHIQLSPELDVRKTQHLYSLGLTPDPIAYGFHHALNTGYDISFSSSVLNGPIYQFIRKSIIKIFCLDLLHAIGNWKKIEQADVVWTVTDVEYLGVLLVLILSNNKNTFVLCNNVWLFDRLTKKPRLYSNLIVRMLVKRANLLTFHSVAHQRKAEEFMEGANLRTVPFGISDEAFVVQKPSKGRTRTTTKIFCPGNDKTRNWDAIHQAFANNSKFDVVIVCDRLPISYFEKASNFRQVKRPTIDEFKELYRSTDFVVVSMYENSYSGITVALEAAAMGVPIVSTDTGGIRTYFDDDEVKYVPLASPDAIRDAILNMPIDEAYNQAVKAQSRFIEDNYRCSRMVADYFSLSVA
ncbi:glycosyltransferase [Methylobacterium sp. GC_Met_2]|uniref:glycosyltransferase n=1 Tax=Methylobacterium sp. GC_Met_2 TaxID=2937376 RepID=UPI00226B490E|nr:glycosyltransferase [Methylobacterium sp. GC_Met_2]